MNRILRGLSAAMSVFTVLACGSQRDATPGTDTTRPPMDSAPPAATVETAASSLRIDVDLAARQLHVVEQGSQIASYPVAVGSERWPTQTGQWTITQVVFNPEWIPPDETWAEEREPRKPGDPRNPLGRIQLVYDPPRSIHGTNQPESIGKAVSHGSIRVTNQVGEQLARQIMEAGGAQKEDAWMDRAKANRSEKQVVDLPRPVPIRVF